MHYFITIIYNVTSGNTKQVLRCQRENWTCHFSFGRQIVSYNKGVVLVNLFKCRIKLSD